MRFIYFIARPLLEAFVAFSLLDFYNLIVLQIPGFIEAKFTVKIVAFYSAFTY
jgi:hypothetical protein